MDINDCDNCTLPNSDLRKSTEIESLRQQLDLMKADLMLAQGDAVRLTGQLAECQSKWEHFENSVAEKSMQCLSLEKELAECQKDGKHYAHEYLIAKDALAECQRDAKRLHVEIHDQAAEIAGNHAMLKFKDEQLAECQRERDAYKAKAVIADIPMSDVEARLKEQLATVIKERDELVATLIECRSSVKFDLNRYERMALDYSRLGPEGEGKLAIADAEANRLHRLIDTIDALAKLGADKTGEV